MKGIYPYPKHGNWQINTAPRLPWEWTHRGKKQVLRQVPTFSEFIEQRYMPFVKGYKRSWISDDSYLRNQLLPIFGKKHLDEITKHDVIQFHHGMRAKDYALGTCNRCLILLRYAMNLAVRWEIPGITANPTKDVPLFEDLAGKKSGS
ncbi:MAG: hypothetical protein WJ129_10055 [Ferrovum myxofaciens]